MTSYTSRSRVEGGGALHGVQHAALQIRPVDEHLGLSSRARLEVEVGARLLDPLDDVLPQGSLALDHKATPLARLRVVVVLLAVAPAASSRSTLCGLGVTITAIVVIAVSAATTRTAGRCTGSLRRVAGGGGVQDGSQTAAGVRVEALSTTSRVAAAGARG